MPRFANNFRCLNSHCFRLVEGGLSLGLWATTLFTAATRGVNYQQQFAASGGTGNVTWTLDGGSLPLGWNISSAGMLSGIATADGFLHLCDQGHRFRKSHADRSGAEPLTITGLSTFPSACVNQPYSFTATTTGGISPIFFGFISDHWVAINLNTSTGTFSGTTNVTGTFTGQFGASDSAQPASSQGQVVTLNVVNCP